MKKVNPIPDRHSTQHYICKKPVLIGKIEMHILMDGHIHEFCLEAKMLPDLAQY